MSWLVLVLSGALEAVWATALSRSDGLTRLLPSAVFVAALVLSMLGLGWALRDLPVGAAYAVWVGIGAVLTVAWAMTTGAEAVTPAKLVFLAAIVGGVVGLKLLP
jgi:quaternary ammonium compound-resistance protein SugE